MTSVTGVLPAMVTPFDRGTGHVDDKAIGELVERFLAAGVDGLVPCGGTGEFASLTDDERRHVVEAVVSHVDGRVPVVPYTGGPTSAAAVAHTRHATDLGAAAVMVGVPYYEPLTPGQVVRFFAEVAECTDLPIVYYNYPYATGVPLGPELLTDLVNAVPQVVGVKDSAGNFSALAALVAAFPEVGFLCGSETLAGPALVAGCVGLINGSANVAPSAYSRMYRAWSDGDVAQTLREWQKLLPLTVFLENHAFVSGVKSALDVLGLPGGGVRSPLDVLTDLEVSALTDVLGGSTTEL